MSTLTVADILQAALKLPATERLRISLELSDSVSPDHVWSEEDPNLAGELNRRSAAYQSGEMTFFNLGRGQCSSDRATETSEDSALTLRITEAAEADISGAMDWYARQREGLGDEFRIAIQDAIAMIGANPSLDGQ